MIYISYMRRVHTEHIYNQTTSVNNHIAITSTTHSKEIIEVH